MEQSHVQIYLKAGAAAAISKCRKALEDELFVDRLLSYFGIKNPSQYYPPKDLKSLQTLVDLVMENEECGSIQKHCIVYYLLKDDTERRHHWEFAELSRMPRSFQLLIDGYWAMDHMDFSDAMYYLSDPTLEPDWGEKIVRTLYLNGRSQDALFYLKVLKPTLKEAQDLLICMDLLMARDITEAFQFQRENASLMPSNVNLMHRMLNRVFTGKPTAVTINRLLSLPYDAAEEVSVIEYCQQNVTPTTQDFLVIFYLIRHRRIEALRLHAELDRKQPRSGTQPASQVRNAMMNTVRSTLLDIERQLLEGMEVDGKEEAAFVLPPRTPSRDHLKSVSKQKAIGKMPDVPFVDGPEQEELCLVPLKTPIRPPVKSTASSSSKDVFKSPMPFVGAKSRGGSNQSSASKPVVPAELPSMSPFSPRRPPKSTPAKPSTSVAAETPSTSAKKPVVIMETPTQKLETIAETVAIQETSTVIVPENLRAAIKKETPSRLYPSIHDVDTPESDAAQYETPLEADKSQQSIAPSPLASLESHSQPTRMPSHVDATPQQAAPSKSWFSGLDTLKSYLSPAAWRASGQQVRPRSPSPPRKESAKKVKTVGGPSRTPARLAETPMRSSRLATSLVKDELEEEETFQSPQTTEVSPQRARRGPSPLKKDDRSSMAPKRIAETSPQRKDNVAPVGSPAKRAVTPSPRRQVVPVAVSPVAKQGVNEGGSFSKRVVEPLQDVSKEPEVTVSPPKRSPAKTPSPKRVGKSPSPQRVSPRRVKINEAAQSEEETTEALAKQVEQIIDSDTSRRVALRKSPERQPSTSSTATTVAVEEPAAKEKRLRTRTTSAEKEISLSALASPEKKVRAMAEPTVPLASTVTPRVLRKRLADVAAAEVSSPASLPLTSSAPSSAFKLNQVSIEEMSQALMASPRSARPRRRRQVAEVAPNEAPVGVASDPMVDVMKPPQVPVAVVQEEVPRSVRRTRRPGSALSNVSAETPSSTPQPAAPKTTGRTATKRTVTATPAAESVNVEMTPSAAAAKRATRSTIRKVKTDDSLPPAELPETPAARRGITSRSSSAPSSSAATPIPDADTAPTETQSEVRKTRFLTKSASTPAPEEKTKARGNAVPSSAQRILTRNRAKE